MSEMMVQVRPGVFVPKDKLNDPRALIEIARADLIASGAVTTRWQDGAGLVEIGSSRTGTYPFIASCFWRPGVNDDAIRAVAGSDEELCKLLGLRLIERNRAQMARLWEDEDDE